MTLRQIESIFGTDKIIDSSEFEGHCLSKCIHPSTREKNVWGAKGGEFLVIVTDKRFDELFHCYKADPYYYVDEGKENRKYKGKKYFGWVTETFNRPISNAFNPVPGWEEDNEKVVGFIEIK